MPDDRAAIAELHPALRLIGDHQTRRPRPLVEAAGVTVPRSWAPSNAW
ncbi:hypothetical protein LZG04_28265 [Saccharothrix sp. S26]|nr:hypothetical protein [Saccharothrix sp. S26]MCE6998662.1 hypothetical protein [Saccharothrix sp. S26]